MTKATYWTYSLDLSNLFAEIFNGFKRIDIIMFVSKCFRILANVYVCNYRGRLDVGHDQFIYYLHLKLRLKAKNDWLVYFRFNSTVTFKHEQWWHCKKLLYLITSKGTLMQIWKFSNIFVFTRYLRILTIKNAKLSGHYFYMNLNIWGDFQICISVTLIL